MIFEHSTNNRRIAKNTFMLYMRMSLIMGVSLYTSRIVLAELGVDDYGVYTVVGGVVSMLSFLNSCMTTSTQRFLNIELGNPLFCPLKLKDIFSTSMTIHGLIAIVVLLLAETIGLWFLNAKLVIPQESIFSANIVYQTSILVFCITIMQAPFNATIIAHEKMQIYATVSILEAILRLGVAFTLILVKTNKLAYYGTFLLTSQLLVTSTYIWLCKRKFEECTFHFKYIPSQFKEMSKFAGWNMFGSIAWLVRGQGMGIILNIFFGPALNAAKGVADQVSTAVTTLNSNFQVALNPQITKHYASNQLYEMELLTYKGLKFSTFLLWAMAFPIILTVNYILTIWLEDIPNYSSIFIVLILFDCILGNLFGYPLMTSLAATGKIRSYQISVSLALLMILPTAFYAMKLGFPPETIFILNIIFNLLAGFLRFWFCKKSLKYSAGKFLKLTILPVLMVGIISSIVPLAIKYYILPKSINYILSMLILIVVSTLSVLTTCWFIGISNNERTALINLIVQKLHRYEKNV